MMSTSGWLTPGREVLHIGKRSRLKRKRFGVKALSSWLSLLTWVSGHSASRKMVAKISGVNFAEPTLIRRTSRSSIRRSSIFLFNYLDESLPHATAEGGLSLYSFDWLKSLFMMKSCFSWSGFRGSSLQDPKKFFALSDIKTRDWPRLEINRLLLLKKKDFYNCLQLNFCFDIAIVDYKKSDLVAGKVLFVEISGKKISLNFQGLWVENWFFQRNDSFIKISIDKCWLCERKVINRRIAKFQQFSGAYFWPLKRTEILRYFWDQVTSKNNLRTKCDSTIFKFVNCHEYLRHELNYHKFIKLNFLVKPFYFPFSLIPTIEVKI